LRIKLPFGSRKARYITKKVRVGKWKNVRTYLTIAAFAISASLREQSSQRHPELDSGSIGITLAVLGPSLSPRPIALPTLFMHKDAHCLDYFGATTRANNRDPLAQKTLAVLISSQVHIPNLAIFQRQAKIHAARRNVQNASHFKILNEKAEGHLRLPPAGAVRPRYGLT
jgi:hypothetical protein